jgi:ATP-dependent exoDNAse (exonuclease V) beta subunit
MKSEDCSEDLIRILDEYFVQRSEKRWTQIVNEAYTQPLLYVLKQLFDILKPWQQYSSNSYDQKYYIANYEHLIEHIIKYAKVDVLTLNQIAEYLKVNILTRQKQLAREIEIETDEIRVICTTIHKSKGLEYGTVILPYTDEDISDIRKVKLDANYVENKLSYIVLFENKIREKNTNYDELTEVTEQIAEEARILYVALTRAIRNCIWIKNLDSKANISWETLLEE